MDEDLKVGSMEHVSKSTFKKKTKSEEFNTHETSEIPALTKVTRPTPGKRGPDKKPRAKAKPRTDNTPKTPGAKVISKKTDIIQASMQDVEVVVPENYEGLNVRQSLFVQYYVRSLNATLAAKQAGYQGNDNTLSSVGYKLLRNADIAKRIKNHYEHQVMTRDEMTFRLSKMVRASFSPFIKIEGDENGRKYVRLDLTSEEAQDYYDVIREIDSRTVNKIITEDDGGEESERLVKQVHVKLHDPLKAMEILAKLYANTCGDNSP